jgi:aspartyl-tRNA(Asn)/glutamyl-tRNA(Gln) amidotransferase subunit B
MQVTQADAAVAKYEPVIGLEVHCQLLTRTKIFCACLNRFGSEPNSHVCPVCLGLPGALPVLSRHAVELAMRAGLATHCTVHNESIFARKNYFYPDLPKGYQISQYEHPLATEGYVEIPVDGSFRRVRLQRIHMEEDAGKLLHEGFPWSGEKSGVDFNRSGVPLIEIVSHPDMRSSEEAYEYLTALKVVLLYTEVSDCNMEEGSLRCDANVSVRLRGSEAFGTRAEIKNLNSFRNVARSIEHEISRQVAILEAGGKVIQETRLWNAERSETVSMRAKADAHDYRYFPEPDLPPLVVAADWVEGVRGALPELPADKRRRFVDVYKIPDYDAGVLTSSRAMADYFESVVSASGNPKAASNWVMGPASTLPVPAVQLAEIVRLVEAGTISFTSGKDVLIKAAASGDAPTTIVEREGLGQVSDEGPIKAAIADVIARSPDQVATYKKGKTGTLGWFVGQVMKQTGGKANPSLVNTLLKKALDA